MVNQQGQIIDTVHVCSFKHGLSSITSLNHDQFPETLETPLVSRVSYRNFTLGGKFTDRVAIGHSEGEDAGGRCAPSRPKCEATNILL